jgi:hypothetical protein
MIAPPLAWIHYTLFLLPLLFRPFLPPAVAIAVCLLITPVSILLDRFMFAPDWQLASIESVYASPFCS